MTQKVENTKEKTKDKKVKVVKVKKPSAMEFNARRGECGNK